MTLLAQIYAAPDDDAPRAVYADLLMQRGDPHGELIACQLGRPRGTQPNDRERALLSALGRNALGPLAPLLGPGYGHSATRLERGFVAVADVGSAGTGRKDSMR
jgi:uncharacterized protein (TIGR02996 family)